MDMQPDQAIAPPRSDRKPPRVRLFASIMLVLLCLIWGLTFPAMKAALQHTDPIHFLFLRFLMAAVLLTPYMALRTARFHKKQQTMASSEPSRYWTRAAVLGGLAVGVLLFAGFALQVGGIRFTTASRSGFFTGLLTIITPILAQLFGTSRSHGLTWIGLFPAMLGIYFLASPETGGLNIGDLLTIGCAFAFALQMVALEAVSKRVKHVWVLTYMQVLAVLGGSLLYLVFYRPEFAITTVGWIAVLYTALLGTVVAVWMQTRFQPDVPAGHAALIFTFEPVFAALAAWLLLGESWTMKGLIGAGFVLFAMMLSSYGTTKQAAKA